jgi:osmotically-inducible protein OsmY
MRTLISFALGLAAGAAAAHFLDPDSGRRRRATMRDQAQSKASQAASAVQSQATHAAHSATGAVVSSVPTGVRLEDADDVTLARKVETEIFRAADAPKGSVSIDVQAGIATLRGEVGEQQWIERLGDEAGHVAGIRGVQNLLHTPGTPTPEAEPRGLAAERMTDN